MSAFFETKTRAPIARRDVSPAQAIAMRRKQYAYSQTWQGKTETRLRYLFNKCKVCATGSLGTHVVTCLVIPNVAPVVMGTASTVVHDPWIMIGSAAVCNAAVYGGWYVFLGRVHTPEIRILNAKTNFVGFAFSSAISLGIDPLLTLGAAIVGYFGKATLSNGGLSKLSMKPTAALVMASLTAATTANIASHFYWGHDFRTAHAYYESQKPEDQNSIRITALKPNPDGSVPYLSVEDYLIKNKICQTKSSETASWLDTKIQDSTRYLMSIVVNIVSPRRPLPPLKKSNPSTKPALNI